MIITKGDRVRRVTGVDARRGARALTKEELTRQLLALVLAAVLVWYTFVIPANTYAKNVANRTPDDAECEGEVRLSDFEFDGDGVSTKDSGVSNVSVDELDWPEYICLD